MSTRHVRGSLFADYVRMIRRADQVDYRRYFGPEDLAYLEMHIDPLGWYPMATFERFGNFILEHVAGGNLNAAQMWGRLQTDQLRELHPELLAADDPVYTLMRFRVLRSTFFDFESLDVRSLEPGECRIVIRYGMGATAEEAASYQTMGFFERLLELAGAAEVQGRFVERSWAGDPRTLLEVTWA